MMTTPRRDDVPESMPTALPLLFLRADLSTVQSRQGSEAST